MCCGGDFNVTRDAGDGKDLIGFVEHVVGWAKTELDRILDRTLAFAKHELYRPAHSAGFPEIRFEVLIQRRRVPVRADAEGNGHVFAVDGVAARRCHHIEISLAFPPLGGAVRG